MEQKQTLERIQREAQDETASVRKKRQDQFVRAKRVLLENEENRKAREAARRHEFDEDKKMISDYARQLDEQERRKTEELRKKEAKMQAFMKLTADTVVKKDENRRREDERKILNNLINKEKQEKEEDERRRREQMNKERSTRAFLDSQVRHKREEAAAEKMRNRELAAKWRNDAELFAREERMKTEATRRKCRAVSQEVLQQIEERRDNDFRQEDMSGLEFAINKKILDSVSKSTLPAA